VLDVRREAEHQAGHLAQSSWWPLDRFKRELPPLAKEARIAVHCKSGYRSMIACSLMQRVGFDGVVNVMGGFDAWEKSGAPVKTKG
jgi:rhodanese-related sulfurtransferase